MKRPIFSSCRSARFVEIDVKPGDALELVERATGDAEPASGDHWHPDLIAGQERREDKRDLVADAAGRMLVHLWRRAPRILKHPSALHHRRGELTSFVRRHPAKENRHRKRAHLVVGDFTPGEAVDERDNLVGRKFVPVAFAFDQARDVHGKLFSGAPRASRERTRLAVANFSPRRNRVSARRRNQHASRVRSPDPSSHAASAKRTDSM